MLKYLTVGLGLNYGESIKFKNSFKIDVKERRRS